MTEKRRPADQSCPAEPARPADRGCPAGPACSAEPPTCPGGPAARTATAFDGSSARGLAAADIAQAGLLIALLAVSAQVSLAIGPVPFTLQTLVVVLVALVCAPVQAALALGGYLALGALGLPVFSAMRGGLAVLAGPTGGYLYGFLVSAVLAALVRRTLCPPATCCGNPVRALVGDVAAGAVVVAGSYAVGTAHFVAVGAVSGAPVDLAYALSACVVPFIVPDALKVAAAVATASALRRAVPSVSER